MTSASERFNKLRHMIPEEFQEMFESLVDNVEPDPCTADLEELASIGVLLGFICSGPELQLMLSLMPERTISTVLLSFLFAAYNIGRARERDPLGGSLE